MMDFGIVKAFVAFWIAWNYWAIVPILIIMAVTAVIWKTAITPTEYHNRILWEQIRENKKLSQAKINRLGTIVLKFIFAFMSSTFFCVALFKMLYK